MAIKFPENREELRTAATGRSRNVGGTGRSLDLNLLGSTEGATTGAFSGRDINEAPIEYDPDLWDSRTLGGDNKYLKPMFEAAKKGLELHKANAKFIKQLYEMNKALMIATIDPIFAAIDRILEEIIAILNSLRGLGFYMIQVTSSTVQQNVQKNPITGALHVGSQTFVPARMNAKGEYEKAIKDADGNYSSAKVIDSLTNEQIYVEYTPLSSKEKPLGPLFPSNKVTRGIGSFLSGDVANEYYIQMNEWTGLTELTPNGILNTIDESFDDEMDLPKHFKQMFLDGDLPPEVTPETVNKTSDMWETIKDETIKAGKYIGKTVEETFDAITDKNYYESGRPNFPASADVAGVIFIIGAPDLAQFNTILDNFNRFISLDGLRDLRKAIRKIIAPVLPKRTLRLQKVCNVNVRKSKGSEAYTSANSASNATVEEIIGETFTKGKDSSGAFNVQSLKKAKRIMNTAGDKVARVSKIISTKPMYIPKRKNNSELESWDQPLTESRIRERAKPAVINANELPYNEQVLEVEMITKTGDFAPGDIIVEAIPAKPREIITPDGDPNKGELSVDKMVAAEAKKMGVPEYSSPKEGRVTVGTVAQAYSMTAVGKPPNWRGQSMEGMFPGLSQVFDRAEAEVRSMQATVKSARKILDPIIDFLDSKIDDVMAFAADIEKILDLFANGVPATGIYSLYLPPQPGGTEKFRERMLAAGGDFKPPEDLKYCAGVCFLGGGPNTGLLVKSVDTLAMLLGFRNLKDSEIQDVATMKAAATPIFNEEEVYDAGDELYYKGKNYKCKKDATSGEHPLHADPVVDPETGIPSGRLVLNAVYWELSDNQPEEDAEVRSGDERTAEQIKKDKIAWLAAAKGRLNEILGWLDGNNTLTGGQNMRAKILAVSLFGKIDSGGTFVGENRNIYDELYQMRENDLRELELLVFRIKEMISRIELMQIQASPGVAYDFKKEPNGVRPGSLRSKGTTLLIINGEFVDFVDDFESGQRRIRENTTITIMDPLSDSSGTTRSIESLSNTTVAILDEPFPVDIDEALAYDIVVPRTIASDYMDEDTSQFVSWVDSTQSEIANTTHYMHPGYRVREYKAKANTISVIMPNDSSNEYDTVPVWNDGEAGPSGQKRTASDYPAGTMIKLNGVVPASEGFVMSDEETVEVIGTVQDATSSWMGIGASSDDKLLVDFGDDTVVSAIILETIGDEYAAIDVPYRKSDNAGIEQFKYHENWEVEIADATAAEQNKKDAIQSSRNKFIKYLKEINTKADDVYVDLQTLEDKTWPPTAAS